MISFTSNILDFRQVTASTEYQSKLDDDVSKYIMTHFSFIVSNKFSKFYPIHNIKKNKKCGN